MSTKSAAEKLLIKPDTGVWTSHPQHLGLIEPLPTGVRVVDAPDAATTVIFFGDDGDSLRELVATHANKLTEAETLWVAYPKGNRTDINRDSLWPILAGHGLRPIGQVSLNEVWSAMRFRPLKPGEAPFTGGAAS
jgi:hypothetical protein